MNTVAIEIGDYVRLNDGVGSAAARAQVYQVTGRLKVNIQVEPVGGGRRARVNPANVIKVDGPEAAPPVARTVPYQSPLDAGEVVELTGRPGLFVVLAQTGDTYRVAKLGGDSGRYYRSVPRSRLTGRPVPAGF